jgi:hypothetical protein
MVPILTRIRSQVIGEFGEPLKHKGEEFIFVLEGKRARARYLFQRRSESCERAHQPCRQWKHLLIRIFNSPLIDKFSFQANYRKSFSYWKNSDSNPVVPLRAPKD